MMRHPSGETVMSLSSADHIGEWLAALLRPLESPTSTVPDRLEQIVLGGARRYTRREVEERAGVTAERSQRLWRALGFADVDDDDVVFTDADIGALQLIDGFVESGYIDADMEAAAARAAGQSLSRLAEWEIDLLSDFMVSRLDDEDEEATEASVLRFVERAIPMMEQLHSYIWRRHVAALAGRALASSSEELVRSALIVGFADVVGYTRLSRNLSETELAQLINGFEAMVTDVVANGNGRVVKTLGDEVLFVADDAVGGASIGLELLERVDAEPEFPDLRIGMARGSVLSRFGDVYGPVVNIASRLTSLAKPGTALVDRELATSLDGEPSFRLRRRRPKAVRGYSNLSSWRVTRASGAY